MAEKSLREKAQDWLDLYKAGPFNDKLNHFFEASEFATIVSEYLYAVKNDKSCTAKPDYKALYDTLKEDYEDLNNECHNYAGEARELSDNLEKADKRIESLEETLEDQAGYIANLEGKVQAYEFVIRCNGVSGKEVKRS